jgi:hypothetical protein
MCLLIHPKGRTIRKVMGKGGFSACTNFLRPSLLMLATGRKMIILRVWVENLFITHFSTQKYLWKVYL